MLYRNLEARELPYCQQASSFTRKLAEMIFRHVQPDNTGLSFGQLRQAKYLLQEEYWRFRRALEPAHRGMLTPKHRCVEDVYQEAWERLDALHRMILPAQDLLMDYEELIAKANQPQQPRQPPINKVPGIFFGEVEYGSEEEP